MQQPPEFHRIRFVRKCCYWNRVELNLVFLLFVCLFLHFGSVPFFKYKFSTMNPQRCNIKIVIYFDTQNNNQTQLFAYLFGLSMGLFMLLDFSWCCKQRQALYTVQLYTNWYSVVQQSSAKCSQLGKNNWIFYVNSHRHDVDHNCKSFYFKFEMWKWFVYIYLEVLILSCGI